jgi:hypothetical protein
MSTERFALACSSGTIDLRAERDGRVRLQITDWFSATSFALLDSKEVSLLIGYAAALAGLEDQATA